MSVEVGVLLSILGFLLAYLGYRRGITKEYLKKGVQEGSTQGDIKYIREKTDDVLLMLKETNKKVDGMNDRLIRVEESTKQAHKRIDVLAKK